MRAAELRAEREATLAERALQLTGQVAELRRENRAAQDWMRWAGARIAELERRLAQAGAFSQEKP